MCHSARTLVAAAAALLLLCCCLGCVRPAAALKFIVVPLPSDNSHVLDTMAVAAQLQARCVFELPLAVVSSSPRPPRTNNRLRMLLLLLSLPLYRTHTHTHTPLWLAHAPHTHRGHAVHVVSDAASQGYLKVAAARHTSNSTAEALRYIHVDLGVPTNLDAVLREVGPMMQRRLKTPGVMGACAPSALGRGRRLLVACPCRMPYSPPSLRAVTTPAAAP
jgi:hypothetical protein